MTQADLGELDAREKRYAAELARMIQAPTISTGAVRPDSAFEEFQGLLAELFPHLHAALDRKLLGGTLLFIWKGNNPNLPALALMSHSDVVDVTGEWRFPPFSGSVAQGRVWGRGTLDTKGNLYAILRAVDDLVAESFSPAQDIYIISSDCEEINGNDLVADWFRENNIHVGLLVDEGTGVQDYPDPAFNRRVCLIGTCEKGYLTLRCIAQGTGGHPMHPGKGTALPRLGAFMQEVDAAAPLIPVVDATSAEQFHRLAALARQSGREDDARRFDALSRQEIGWEALAGQKLVEDLGVICAFLSATSVGARGALPQEASAQLEIHIPAGRTIADVMDALAPIAQRHGIVLEQVDGLESSVMSSFDGPGFARVTQAYNTAYPDIPVLPAVLGGDTDCKHFTSVCDEVFRVSPLYADDDQRSRTHGIDENIFTSSLPPAVDFFKALVRGNELVE